MLGKYMGLEDEDEFAEFERIRKHKKKEDILLIISVLSLFFLLAMLLFSLSSCTLSFQNISTHGTANDLVDEEQTNDPVVSPTTSLSLPLKAL